MNYWEGPPRGTSSSGWDVKLHRTLAEIDAGVGPSPGEVETYRRGRVVTLRRLMTDKDGDAP